MALFFADLVREASWGTGDGDLPLGGALPGHRSFADAVPPGARFHYAISGVTNPGEWETGEGEIGEGGALARTPIDSSAGGAAVDFSPGLKTVALTVAAAWFAGKEAEGGIDSASLDAKADLAGGTFTGAIAAPGLSLETPLAISSGGTGSSDAAAARAALGLAIGEDVEAHHPNLDALADLASGAGVIEQTGAGLFAVRAIGAAADSDLLSRGDGDARYQPADSDLTAIAALSTTSFGRGLLTVANAAAGRTALGLGTAAVAATGTGASDVPTTAAADARYLRSVAPALNSDGSAGSTWTAISGPAFGTSTNSTGSSNFPSTFGGTISFKLDTSASSWARAFDLWKANQTTNLYLRAYSATGTPTAWVQIWHDGNDGAGSGLDADKLDGQEGSYYAPIASPNFSGTAQYGGIEIGWRDLPRTTSGLTRGQCLATSAGVTITAGAAAGSRYAVYNDSGAAITLTQGSGLTLRLAGSATTGSRTLAARGFATIWFNSTSEAIVSGTGVS